MSRRAFSGQLLPRCSESSQECCRKMRERTGLTDDDGALVDHVLGGDPPLLAINPSSTVSEKSEHSGFANLVLGTFGMLRNLSAHEALVHWEMIKDDAEDL
ncbi:TIGR02391 family protein [Pseudomonas viridiflava]|uniref:TIGR02391 family protein n=1 Tax=Pseudomonas viridiflava TaxID=33069 RepID=UPI0039B8FB8B